MFAANRMYGLLLVLLLMSTCLVSSPLLADTFHWPQGKQAAVSLSFDDARESQVDVGIPLLNEYGIKATFYVLPIPVKERLSDWKAAVISGHEIGNHSMTHPCRSLTTRMGRTLENYTLERMATEIDAANLAIETMLGVTPVSFAYPCGHNYIGRGQNAQSYVPIVAQKFHTGRNWLAELNNNPGYCDFSDLMGRSFDCLDFQEVKEMIDVVLENGYWLILVGHDIGDEGEQVVKTETLKALCQYLKNPENGIWVAPIAEIASYIAANRTANIEASFAKPRRLYLGLWTIAGIVSFLGSFLIFIKSPALIAKFMLLTGTIALFCLSCWSIRYGFIGYKPFMLILIIVGFLLGCLCAVVRQTRLLKNNIILKNVKAKRSA